MASAQLSELMANITTLRTKRRLPDMLRCMEDALALRVTMHGELSTDVQEAAASLLKEYNAAAMSMLRSGSFSQLMRFASLATDTHALIGSTVNAKSVLDKVRAPKPDVEHPRKGENSRPILSCRQWRALATRTS